jgi:predicted O-methyltransferase YrrM
MNFYNFFCKHNYKKNFLYIKNILIFIFFGNNFFVIINKFFKRFEINSSVKAKKWARLNTKYTTEKFCKTIDSFLYNKILLDVQSIETEAKYKLSKLNVSLGGGGNYVLLYFLVRKIKPNIVVETGVAAGWSSLAILRALKKNGKGKLYSSDFPYFRLESPTQYIGYLAKNEINKIDWFLDIRGDDLAIPEILKRIGNNNIDLIHYDSDKSYSGRNTVFKNLFPKINNKTIIIFDDIQDNLHFKNLIERTKKDYFILKFKGKYLGIIGANFLLKEQI